MPLDPVHVGRRFASGPPYEVGREKIREFADAIGDPHAAYRKPEAARVLGYPDVIAPHTFPIVVTYAANLPLLAEFGVEPRHLVHGSQRFEYTRPVLAGDRLCCPVTITNIRMIDGADFLTTRADVCTADGEPVVTAWCALVIRGHG